MEIFLKKFIGKKYPIIDRTGLFTQRRKQRFKENHWREILIPWLIKFWGQGKNAMGIFERG